MDVSSNSNPPFSPPNSVIAAITIDAKPAAGPDTPIAELEMNPTTIPPMTPATIPEKSGAPEAKAIPKQSGSATQNTTTPEDKSVRHVDKIFFI